MTGKRPREEEDDDDDDGAVAEGGGRMASSVRDAIMERWASGEYAVPIPHGAVAADFAIVQAAQLAAATARNVRESQRLKLIADLISGEEMAGVYKWEHFEEDMEKILAKMREQQLYKQLLSPETRERLRAMERDRMASIGSWADEGDDDHRDEIGLWMLDIGRDT
jgi:hypothetical protein